MGEGATAVVEALGREPPDAVPLLVQDVELVATRGGNGPLSASFQGSHRDRRHVVSHPLHQDGVAVRVLDLHLPVAPVFMGAPIQGDPEGDLGRSLHRGTEGRREHDQQHCAAEDGENDNGNQESSKRKLFRGSAFRCARHDISSKGLEKLPFIHSILF